MSKINRREFIKSTTYSALSLGTVRIRETSANTEPDFVDSEHIFVRRGVFLLDWPERVKKVELYLKNKTDSPIKAKLFIAEDTKDVKYAGDELRNKRAEYVSAKKSVRDSLSLRQFKEVLHAESIVKSNFEGWVTFEFKDKHKLHLRDDRSFEPKLLLCLSSVPGLYWGIFSKSCDYAKRCEISKDGSISMFDEPHLFRIYPRPSHGEAVNIINGHNRRYGKTPANMWIAEEGAALPQWVELDFGEDREFNRIQITFDGLYEHSYLMPYNTDKRVSEMMVSDYEIQILKGGDWRTIVQVENNYNRHRIHTFPNVISRKVRLVCTAMNSDSYSPRVYEIRAELKDKPIFQRKDAEL